MTNRSATFWRGTITAEHRSTSTVTLQRRRPGTEQSTYYDGEQHEHLLLRRERPGDRLVRVASNNSYSYDLNGNRNSTGYTTGAGNEMTNSPGVTYTYDNDGNMITATTSSGTTTYTYDYENRLTNVDGRRDDGGDLHV